MATLPSVQNILADKSKRVISIAEDCSVLVAARQMNDHRIGALVVTRGEKVVGIFTERDILCRVVAEEKNPADVKVGTVMSSPVAVCTPETSRDECRAVMRARRLRHLPVVKDDQLVGMVSIGDLYEANEIEQDQTIKYLNEYLYGAR